MDIDNEGEKAEREEEHGEEQPPEKKQRADHEARQAAEEARLSEEKQAKVELEATREQLKDRVSNEEWFTIAAQMAKVEAAKEAAKATTAKSAGKSGAAAGEQVLCVAQIAPIIKGLAEALVALQESRQTWART